MSQENQNNYNKTNGKFLKLNGNNYIEINMPAIDKKFYFNAKGFSRLQREKMRIDCIRVMRHLEVMENV